MQRSRLAAVIWALGLTAVAVQALALASRYFQPWLSADYIYPQLFAEDVLAGRYPLAGWTLSSAPYFFPDFLILIVLRAVGGAGTVLPAYVVFSYVTLAVAAGWALQAVTRAGERAWLGGVVLVNVLLAWQVVGDHAHYLWLLGTAGFHGGAVLLGLANLAWWTAPVPDRQPERIRWWGGVAILALGAWSDTLFLTQAALPLGVALLAVSGWKGRDRRVRAYASALGVALAGVALLRLGLLVGGWFQFSKVIRYAPTPAAMAQALEKFGHDAWTVLLPGSWGLLLLLGAAMGLGVVVWRRARRAVVNKDTPPAVATWYVGCAVASTLLFPLLTAYWRDEHHVRYLLPVLVLPGWWLMRQVVRVSGARWVNGYGLSVVGLCFAGLITWAMPNIRRAELTWPYPPEQAQLDAYLAEQGLTHGLSDYWQAHRLNTLSHAGVRLFALRSNGRAFFWNNNAYWFYDSAGPDTPLTLSAYEFVITNGLDEAALVRRFGEPASRAVVAGYTVWHYTSGEGGGVLTQGVRAEVDAFLYGRPGAHRLPAIAPKSAAAQSD